MYTGGDHEREDDSGARASPAAGTSASPAGAAAPASGADDPGSGQDRPVPSHPPLDPERYAVGDEPLGPGRPVDYRYLYGLVLDRLEREEERGKSLDGKLAALLAGVVASIGFSFRVQANIVSAGAAVLYLVPLVLIAWGYAIALEKDAPSAEALEASFPAYPVSTLVEAIKAMRIANVLNVERHDRKAVFLDYAIFATLVVTAIVLIAQFVIALGAVQVERPTATIRDTASAVPVGKRRTP